MPFIRKAWENSFNGQVIITIPKDNEDGIIDQDWVRIEKVQPPVKKTVCSKCGRKYGLHTVNELVKHNLLLK